MSALASFLDTNTHSSLVFQVCDGSYPFPQSAGSSTELVSDNSGVKLAGNATSSSSAPALASPASSPSKQFMCFPNLPAELRLKIWAFSIQPRVVAVAFIQFNPRKVQHYHTGLGINSLGASQMAARKRQHPVPALLHVNVEARAVALQAYDFTLLCSPAAQVSYDNHLGSNPSSFPTSLSSFDRARNHGSTWFHYSLDTVLLLGNLTPVRLPPSTTANSRASSDTRSIIQYLDPDDPSSVRLTRVAIPFSSLSDIECNELDSAISCLQSRFPVAKALLITLNKGDWKDGFFPDSAAGDDHDDDAMLKEAVHNCTENVVPRAALTVQPGDEDEKTASMLWWWHLLFSTLDRRIEPRRISIVLEKDLVVNTCE